MHSSWLESMINPVGQERLEPVGLAAVSKHRELQLLLAHELATVSIKVKHFFITIFYAVFYNYPAYLMVAYFH